MCPPTPSSVPEYASAWGDVDSGLEVIARVAALPDIEPRRINVLQLRVGGEAVFHFDFEESLRVVVGRGIGEHGGHADAVAGMDAIAEAGYSLPFVHLAAGAEDMLLVIGTEKVRAAGVQATWCRSAPGKVLPASSVRRG